MMDRIFQSASKVLVWLGEATGGSVKAMRLMQRIPTSEKRVDEAILHGKFPDIIDPVWIDVKELLNRDYFFRVWVNSVRNTLLALAHSCDRWFRRSL